MNTDHAALPRLPLRENLLELLKSSVNSHMFRAFYLIQPDGKMDEVTRHGLFSCAFFASFVLAPFGLLREGVHLAVDSVIEDMELSGWIESGDAPQPGDVIVWQGQVAPEDGKFHKHIGFCVSPTEAISHGDVGWPRKHDLHNRAIESAWYHPYVREPQPIVLKPGRRGL